jgi:hypothetical protein
MASTDEVGAAASDGILTNDGHRATIATEHGYISHALWHFERRGVILPPMSSVAVGRDSPAETLSCRRDRP